MIWPTNDDIGRQVIYIGHGGERDLRKSRTEFEANETENARDTDVTDRNALCYRLGLHADPWCTCGTCMQRLFGHVAALEKELADLKEGRTCVLPLTREHALNMLTVAEALVYGNAHVEPLQKSPT